MCLKQCTQPAYNDKNIHLFFFNSHLGVVVWSHTVQTPPTTTGGLSDISISCPLHLSAIFFKCTLWFSVHIQYNWEDFIFTRPVSVIYSTNTFDVTSFKHSEYNFDDLNFDLGLFRAGYKPLLQQEEHKRCTQTLTQKCVSLPLIQLLFYKTGFLLNMTHGI